MWRKSPQFFGVFGNSKPLLVRGHCIAAAPGSGSTVRHSRRNNPSVWSSPGLAHSVGESDEEAATTQTGNWMTCGIPLPESPTGESLLRPLSETNGQQTASKRCKRHLGAVFRLIG